MTGNAVLYLRALNACPVLPVSLHVRKHWHSLHMYGRLRPAGMIDELLPHICMSQALVVHCACKASETRCAGNCAQQPTWSVLCGSMTGPDRRWHSARSQSDKGFARDVSMSASKKSAQDICLKGVATLKSVVEKNIRVSCKQVASLWHKSCCGHNCLLALLRCIHKQISCTSY